MAGVSPQLVLTKGAGIRALGPLVRNPPPFAPLQCA